MSAGSLLDAMEGASGAFADGKEPDALRTIGEVARALGIRQHVLRYWEDQFPMLKPLKRSGGRRYYRPADVDLVRDIDRLVHHEGYTLKGARLALSPGSKRTAAVAAGGAEQPVPSRQDFALRARLVAVRTALADALRES